MKAVIAILIIMAVAWFAVTFKNYASREMSDKGTPAATGFAPGKLPGLPAELETGLEAAKREGPEGLKKWLARHGSEVADPRLVDIELDYVILAGRENPGEARRVLNLVKRRITPESPVFKKFEQLNKAYP
jgi:hypothetical protein